MNKKTKVISAFPGTGKTTFFEKTKLDVIDSDSSKFSWIDHPNGVRNPDFPANYIEHIKANIGKVDYILVSTHQEVRSALSEAGIEFILIYPSRILKEEYLKRYRDRGSFDSFVKLLDEKWDEFLDQLDNEEIYMKIVLGKNHYLSNMFEPKED